MYQDKWHEIKFSEQEKKQLTEQIQAQMQQQYNHNKPFYKPLRPIAIALLLIVFVTAVGYAATNIRNVIKDTCKGTPTAIADFEKGITYIGMTEQWNGWSMTLTDVVGDYNGVWIGFELKSPEGIHFDPERAYHFNHTELTPDYLHQGINLYDVTVIDDHTLTGLLKLESYGTNNTQKPEFQNKKIRLILSGFYDIYDELDPTAETERYIRQTCTEDYQAVNQHTWVFDDVPLDYKTIEITLTPNEKVSVFQGDATLTKIVISPLSVTARVEGEGCKDHHFKPTSRPEAYHDSTLKALDGSVYNQGCWRELDIKVICKDGSELKFSSSSGSCDDKKSPYYLEQTKRTDHIIDLQNIAYIEVCGKQYIIPIENNE